MKFEIKSIQNYVFQIFQLINKFDGLLFTKNDENFVEAFAIFCGMGIHNTHMYEKAITAMAKQSVTLDVSILSHPIVYFAHSALMSSSLVDSLPNRYPSR